MNFKKVFSFLLIIFYFKLFLTGCTVNNINPKADIVLKNGYVYTVDSIRTIAQSVAISNKKIIFVGSNDSIDQYIGESTKVIDLKGKLVLPGFIDSHCHPISSYRHFFEINLSGTDSITGYLQVIENYFKEHPDAKYIKGRGWSNTLFPKSGPDKKLLDKIVKDIPVSLSSEDGHSKWVNSKTLELSDITNKTKNPAGGVIERYPGTNEPNGTLRENAADLVSDIFPSYTVEQLIQGLEAYQEMALSFGITTAHDAYLDAGSDEPEAYRELESSNKLKMRIRASLYIDPDLDFDQIKNLVEEREKNKGELFQTNSAKIFIDGVVEGSTAFLKEPYKHLPKSYGEFLWKQDKLNKMCTELEKNNFQIHVHAIGDAAVSATLDAFVYAFTNNYNLQTRNTITHLQLVDPKDILRFKQYNVVAVPQPYWFVKDDYYYNIQVPYLGQKRADEEYPMESFFKAGVTVASSSDYPVTDPPNPLIAIQIGITRLQPGTKDPKEILWKEERATLDQMIESFTINGAYANFLEKETGSIEKGKFADLIVLNKNLFKIRKDEISKAKVLLTLFEGEEVFRDSTFTTTNNN